MTTAKPEAQHHNRPLSASCPETVRLRAHIDRLTSELARRKSDTRPLPSSVMRAYQALIDKQFAQLAHLEANRELG